MGPWLCSDSLGTLDDEASTAPSNVARAAFVRSGGGTASGGRDRELRWRRDDGGELVASRPSQAVCAFPCAIVHKCAAARAVPLSTCVADVNWLRVVEAR